MTGSIAMQIGLARSQKSGGRHAIAALDFVASDLDVVHSSVTSAFLVSHYHAPQPDAPKFMVQLVDPVSRIRVDFFPDLAGAIEGAQTVTITEHRLKVLTLAQIFGHKVPSVAKATRQRDGDAEARCQRCAASRTERFPLASRQQIVDILG